MTLAELWRRIVSGSADSIGGPILHQSKPPVPPFRADPVNYWAVQGFAGVLSILRDQLDAGLIPADQAVIDLRFVAAVTANLLAKIDGKPQLPLPGGASGPMARHFPV